MIVDDVVYADRPTGPLALRIFRPPESPRYPVAVLHLHGGAWRVGSPQMLDGRSALLAERGYTVIQVQYRLLGQAAWPAPVSDLRAALRWVAAHAEDLKVRSDQLVLWGHSAGGHIALTTAATRNDPVADDPGDPVAVAAVIDCYAPVSFRADGESLITLGPGGLDLAAIARHQRNDGALPAVDLLERPCTQAQADAISPLALAARDFPPTMLVHGTSDVLILPVNSRRLAERLTSLGVTAEIVEFAHCNHEFDAAPSYAAALTAHIDVFLRRVLREPSLAREMQRYSMFP